MMLYRKFRPDSFAAILQQKQITEVLKAAIVQNKIAHAYLFCGTRGVGKTTTARIFAKTINCLSLRNGEACNVCTSCKSFNDGTNVDLVEIDAASNRGIDDIRDIKEKIGFAPAVSVYKVYIIDEVHMLTKDAFNALLKTLEEPPKGVVFILATTEVYKVPITVISRCQRFDFHNASFEELRRQIASVAEQEKIKLDNESINLIADVAEGSFRDSLSILEKLLSIDTKITYEKALSILGIPDERLITDLLQSIVLGDAAQSISLFHEAIDQGIDVYQLNKMVLKQLEKQLLHNINGEKGVKFVPLRDVLICIKEFLKAERILKNSSVPIIALETSIIKLCRLHTKKEEKILVKTAAAARRTPKVIESRAPAPKEIKRELPEQKKSDVKVDAPSISIEIHDIMDKWNEIVQKVRPINPHLASFLSKAIPLSIEGSFVTIEVKYDFHKDRIEGIKTREILADILGEVYGVKLFLTCTVNGEQEVKIVESIHEEGSDGQETDEEVQEVVVGADIMEEAMKIFEIE